MARKSASKKLLSAIFFVTISLGVLFYVALKIRSGTDFQKSRASNYTKSSDIIEAGKPFYSGDGEQPFQLSAWIDIGLDNSVRGYWQTYTSATPSTPPSEREINYAKNALRHTYHTNQIYLIYHRQYELDIAKEVFLQWKQAPVYSTYAPLIIPTLVLQDYETESCNFTNEELTDLLIFLKGNVNKDAIAVYDVWNTAERPSRNYCNQLNLIKSVHGGKLHRVGLQQNEALAPFDVAVQDTYAAVSLGETNRIWKTSCGYLGTASAQETLSRWIDERVNVGRVAWDFIVVAFDYTRNPPCGADGLLEGDTPLPKGRTKLVHDLIVSRYPGGGAHPNWAGFSLDFKIINLHSLAKDNKQKSLYNTLRTGKKYSGYWSGALNEVIKYYDLYDTPAQ